MSNAFASAIFLARNTDKVKHGEIARTPVVMAQTGSLINKVSQIDNSIGKGTQTALDAFEKSSKVKFGSKALNIAGDLVNPLLVASSVVRVATADDKEAALYKESGGMGYMFAAEGLMKHKVVKEIVRQKGDDATVAIIKHLSKVIKPLENMSEKSQNKAVKLGSFIISGIAFAAASILGYSTGSELGKNVLKEKRKIFNNKGHHQKEAKTNVQVANVMNPNKENFAIES